MPRTFPPPIRQPVFRGLTPAQRDAVAPPSARVVNRLLITRGTERPPPRGKIKRFCRPHNSDRVQNRLLVSLAAPPPSLWVPRHTLWLPGRRLRSAAYDADAQAYFDKDSGIAPSSDQKNAINDWVLAGKANGWWTNLHAAGLLCWGAATPNSKQIKAGTESSFSGGTVIHNSTSWTGGTGGYLNTGLAATSVSMSTSGCCWGLIITDVTTANTNAVDMGAISGSDQTIFMKRNSGVGDVFRAGNNSTAQVANTTYSGTNGLWFGNRYSTSGIDLIRYNGSKTVIASTTSASGGTFSAISFFVGCYNNSGSPTDYSDRDYCLWFMGRGWSQAIADLFSVDTWALKTALGI